MIVVARHGSRLPETLARLAADGVPAMGCPLMATRPLPPPPLPKACRGVILTSPSALPALEPTALPVHCVGLTTAHAVQNAGFTVGHVGRGGAAALAADLKTALPPCLLAHLAGDTADDTWHADLEAAGFTVTRLPAYTTVYTNELPPDVVWQLSQNGVSCVMVFSAASARHFAGLAGDVSSLEAVCLSQAVAEAWPGPTRVAATPTLEAMIDLLTNKKG
jgi:uroporphyrinogen-III synthase